MSKVNPIARRYREFSDKIAAINSITRSPIPVQVSMCHGDRPITSRCSMTAHPNKKKARVISYERYWRAWFGSKTGSSVRSIGQQYTKNGGPGRKQKQQQQQQHQQPCRVNTTSPPFPVPSAPYRVTPFPPTRRVRPERIPSRFCRRSPLLAIHEHPTGTQILSLLRFSSSPPLANGRPYHVPRPPLRCQQGGSYVPWVGGAHGRNMCNAQPWLHAGL